MIKKIKEKTDYYIEFSEEDLTELNLKKCQKFSVEEKDGEILLVPYAEVEIELSEFSREMLEWIITESCDKDVSVNQIVEDALRNTLKLEQGN